MRYENKFVLDASFYDVAYCKIMTSSSFFTEIYDERRVNNIYLDTTEFANLNDNIMGVPDRTKHRIRWYGYDLRIENPILEYKIKRGELGYKEYMKLPAFVLDNDFDYSAYLLKIKECIHSSNEQGHLMYNEITMEIPTLFNSYTRRYFLSNDGKFRITLDKDLVYNGIGRRYNNSFQFKDDRVVLELKYEKEDASRVHNIADELGCRVSRNSKYVTGMNGIYYNCFT